MSAWCWQIWYSILTFSPFQFRSQVDPSLLTAAPAPTHILPHRHRGFSSPSGTLRSLFAIVGTRWYLIQVEHSGSSGIYAVPWRRPRWPAELQPCRPQGFLGHLGCCHSSRPASPWPGGKQGATMLMLEEATPHPHPRRYQVTRVALGSRKWLLWLRAPHLLFWSLGSPGA